MRRFVRRIHETVLPVAFVHRDDRVVEERPGHGGVHLRAGVDQHGICIEPCDAQHLHEKRGLVTAHAVAVLERDVYVVRLVARRAVLHRDAHVAHFLRHELEERAHLRLARGTVLHDALHLVRHRGRGGDEVRQADVPIPARHGLPVLGRGYPERLHARGKRRHVRLRKRLRHVAHVPPEERAAVAERTVLRAHDGLPERMAHGCVAHGVGVGLVHRINGGDDWRRKLEELHVRPRASHAGLLRAARVADVADFAHGKPGNYAGHRLVERIHDVSAEGGVVGGDLERLLEVHLAHLAVHADDLDKEYLRVAVAFREIKRECRSRTPPLLREHFDPFVVPRDLRAVRLVGHVDAVVHHHAVGVGEDRGRDLGRGGDDRRRISAVRGGHVGDFSRANGACEKADQSEQPPLELTFVICEQLWHWPFVNNLFHVVL